MMVQFFSSANGDSELANFGKTNLNNYKSQAARSAAYSANLNALFDYQATSTGVMPYVGYLNYSWLDAWGEKNNWGLVDLMDNAYDGEQATTSTSCVDDWGFKCGHDLRNCGNFIGPVSNTNAAINALVDTYH